MLLLSVPTTDCDSNLKKVIKVGVNVVPLNFSHGLPEDHLQLATKVRTIAKSLAQHVAILGDL